jgi:hypothetical protein
MERPDYPTQLHLDNWFQYHAPAVGQVASYERIRLAGKHFAETIFDLCPSSADRTDAIRKVREAVMTANASIACGGK